MHELGNIRGQRCRAGDAELEPAPEPLPNGAEHQPVGDRVLDREQPGWLAPAAFQPRYLQTDAERPVEDLEFGATLFADLGPDPGVHLLEDPRYGGHRVRFHDRKVDDDPVDSTVYRRRVAHRQLRGKQGLAK